MRVLSLSEADFQQLTRKHPKLKRRFESVAARKGQKLEARARRQAEGHTIADEIESEELEEVTPADID
jgi:signal-transduction protein with cAMP-binding, CBS, and nucleotidyltransferase domain